MNVRREISAPPSVWPLPSDSRFELAPGTRVVLLDDEAAVFNSFTWETHVLNPAAALVLEYVQSGPCTGAELERLLADALDETESARAGEHAARLLQELTALRLMVRHADPADACR